MTIDLITLRDILSNWDQSPALNAARAHELRQPYHHLDRLFPKRIVPIELGRRLQQEDPSSTIFFIQIKVLPAEVLDQYTKPEYAVVWPAPDWRQSTEYKWITSQSWAADRSALLRKNAHSDRIQRMAKKIQATGLKLQFISDLLMQIETEEKLKNTIESFEQVLKIPIYETPDPGPQAQEHRPQSQEEVSATRNESTEDSRQDCQHPSTSGQENEPATLSTEQTAQGRSTNIHRGPEPEGSNPSGPNDRL